MTKIKKSWGDDLTWSHATIHVWGLYMNVISCVIRQAELKYVVLPILKFYFFVRMPKRSGNCTTIFQWNGKYRKCKAKRNAFFDHILLIYNTLCFKIRGKSAIVRRLSICLPKTSKGKIKDFLIKNQMEFMCLRFRN